ncbi:hypothetical protein XU18_3827 [Perkinsela sp. CCAP 1560/4]|nr:hypothetical protein XU18_5007 [Perkinsela sp. CCAP 1560/4]KNH05052.1 hypothetical protein XU18_3827 [Perkinsela sp. CCAP 1560/4]|eukprot:KNH03667.1 hypothetical protein XU18_5007 [Perkinsela sp. CCAP 1560/4]
MHISDLKNARGRTTSMNSSQNSKWCVTPKEHNYASRASFAQKKEAEGKLQSRSMYDKVSDANIQKMKSQLAMDDWADDEDFDDEKTFVHQKRVSPPHEAVSATSSHSKSDRKNLDPSTSTDELYELESSKNEKDQGFDQFLVNKRLGAWSKKMSEYTDEQYTTPIPQNLSDDQRAWARRKEKEIVQSQVLSIHHNIERSQDFAGNKLYEDRDEESLYSSVERKIILPVESSKPGVYVPPSKRTGMSEVDESRKKPEIEEKPAPMQIPQLNMAKVSAPVFESPGSPVDHKTVKKLNPNATAFLPPSMPPSLPSQDSRVVHEAPAVKDLSSSMNKLNIKQPEIVSPEPEIRPEPAKVSTSNAKQIARHISSNLHAMAKISKSHLRHSEKLLKTESTKTPLDESQTASVHPMQLKPKKSTVTPSYSEYPQRYEEKQPSLKGIRVNYGPDQGFSPRGHVQMVSISPRARMTSLSSALPTTSFDGNHVSGGHPSQGFQSYSHPMESRIPVSVKFPPHAGEKTMTPPEVHCLPRGHVVYPDQDSFHLRSPPGHRQLPHTKEFELPHRRDYSSDMNAFEIGRPVHYPPNVHPGEIFPRPTLVERSVLPAKPAATQIVYDEATNSITVGQSSSTYQPIRQSSLRLLAGDVAESELESPPVNLQSGTRETCAENPQMRRPSAEGMPKADMPSSNMCFSKPSESRSRPEYIDDVECQRTTSASTTRDGSQSHDENSTGEFSNPSKFADRKPNTMESDPSYSSFGDFSGKGSRQNPSSNRRDGRYHSQKSGSKYAENSYDDRKNFEKDLFESRQSRGRTFREPSRYKSYSESNGEENPYKAFGGGYRGRPRGNA